MHTKAALGEAYDRAAQAYDQTAGAIYLRTFWSLAPHANVGPKPSILDVGCGTGINLLEAARALGPCRELVGVDLSPGMLEVARHKAQSAGVTARFAIGDAEALELPDASFDLVICNSAFHWFPDRARALREVARVLRPGGQLLLATLAAPGYEEWVAVVERVWSEVYRQPCAAFPAMPTTVELCAHLRAAGLSVEHLQYRITPAVVSDVTGFLATMAVVAPVWLGADAGRLMAAARRAMTTGGRGFVCTQAGMEVAARKGAPIPRVGG